MAHPRILFMGTPSFALPALEQLSARNYTVIGVVTQPDRPRGRGQKEVAPPVKLLAQKLGLSVFQPEKVKDPSFLKIFHELNPEMVVVAAYGQILPKAIIDFPPLKCLNIHPSLLPKYRGAAPINWALIRGETKTGVTIMQMDEGMDSGDILLQKETVIDAAEDYVHLHDRLAIQGAALLIETIDRVSTGTALRKPQDVSGVTFAPRLKKETGRINWNSDAGNIVNLIRGLSPEPAAYTFFSGQILKIFTAEAVGSDVKDIPGAIGPLTSRGLTVAAANGYVFLKEIQLAGKKRMTVNDFLRGYRLNSKTILG
ncbi:MAG: methionyl-tRNA formyltransferase [Smithellaceae bacterium]